MKRPISRRCILFLFLESVVFAQTDSDRYPILKNDKLGFIDGTGREVIPSQFGTAADATRFREGAANVGGSGGWGYIDASGQFIVEPKFWWAYPFSEGFACVLLPGEGSGYGFIDKTGALLIKGLKNDSEFHDGLAPISLSGKWGYLAANMKVAIPPQFDLACRFSEGMAEIQIGKKWGYIDKTGQIAVRTKYDHAMPFSDGLGRVRVVLENRPFPPGTAIEGQRTYPVYRWGFVDRRGIEIVPLNLLDATDFSEGHAFAIPDNGPRRFGIIDKSGEFAKEPAFDEATAFSESLAAVRVGDKWGYVDHAGSWVIPSTFSHAEPFWHGLARVAFGTNQWGYINKNGSVVWQNQSK